MYIKTSDVSLRKKNFFILIFFLVLGPVLKCQPYYFHHYQVEQGLSHNAVSSILQDRQGFLWFGTKDGLNRFDGYTFKVFRNEAQDTTSVGSNYVLNLCEYNGRLWVGTDRGLYQYNEKTEKFTLLKETKNTYIRDIAKDENGNLWFISNYTLSRYNESDRSLITFEPSRYFDATSISSSPEGILWVASASGFIHQYDAALHAFKSYYVFEHSKPVPTHWIETIYCTTEGSILIGTQSQGIKIFDIAKADYRDVLSYDQDHAGLFVRDFVYNTGDEYWVATESGIYILDSKKETITNLRKNYNDPYSISDNAVYTVYKDREGGIWAGTYFGGINHYPKQYTSFEKFFPKIGENSISGNAVREICQDTDGNFWIGTEDAGLNKYNPQSGTFTNFKPTGDKAGISHHNIHGLLARGNELWIGTFHQGLDVMDIRTGSVIRHYSAGTEPGALKSNFIYSLLETQSGAVCLATSAGIYQYQPVNDNFKTLEAFPQLQHYTFIMEDSQGILWAGTYMEGVYYYNPKTQEKGYFKNVPGDSTSLSSNAVNGIFEDSQQNLWITTAVGLNKFDPQKRCFLRYTTRNGLPSNVIYSIEEDHEQKLWISTSKGLVWFDPATEEMKVYTKAHGLLSDQMNYSSSYQDKTGRLYFGSVKGLISFNPAEFAKDNFIPPVYLTGFQVHDKELTIEADGATLQESVTFTEHIKLNHDQSTFSLDFAALSYTAPQITEYAFKMEGLDQEWTYLKTNRKVFFTELPPGSYTFMVKASNSSGIWNTKAATLNIEIIPPFWASTWAYVLYSLVVIFMIAYSIYAYHKRAEKKNKRKIMLLENEKEKEIYQAKIEFFTNIAHEIRTPLTLIHGPLEKIVNETQDTPEIRDNVLVIEKNTNRLLELVNQLLDFRKTETKGFSLNFTQANISKLIEETYLRFKPTAEQKSLNFKIYVPDTPVLAFVDREACTKILSNLFTNSLKYAAHDVSIHLLPPKHGASYFKVEIKNDGYLLPPEIKEKIFTPFFRLKATETKPGTGLGLPLSRSLAELHNGYLIMKDPENDLNVFELCLPLHQTHEYKLYHEETRPEIVTSHANENESRAGNQPAILLIEDNPEMRAFISGELSYDYIIYQASDGKKALETLAAKSIQLIVSDIMMPGTDGIEICRQIKSNLEYSHIPVILLTAKTNLQSKIEGLASGADAYMEKPFSPAHLRAQIANLLSNRTKIKDFFSGSPLAHLKSIASSKADESFLEELNEAINKHISDTDLNVEHLADIMNMSRPTLYRKIKAISDLTPNELINLARLKKSAALLSEGNYKIYEIASMVGYSSQTSFGRNFLKQFKMKPSEYANAKRNVLSK